MEYRKLSEAGQIHHALAEFSDCFPHLLEKVESLADFAKKLSEYAEVYEAFLEENVVGITCFYANDREKNCGYITLIGVKATVRAKGLGKELLRFSLKKMQEKGMLTARLEVDGDNHRAIGFYEHLGFQKETESETGFYMTKEIAL